MATDPQPEPETVEATPASNEAEADEGQTDVPAAGQVRVRPEQSTDDTDAGWGERRDESGHDRWLREQRPPHWE